MTLTRDLLEKTYTIDEFMQMPESDEERGVRFELVNGRIVEVPLAGYTHGRIERRLILKLGNFVENTGLGEIFTGDTSFVIDEARRIVREPDVSFIAKDRLPPEINGAVPITPDFLVEIMSDHDYQNPGEFRTKLIQYQDAGVALIWVVKPREKLVEVYHLSSRAPVATLTETDELSGESVIPGFTLKVRAIFNG